MSAINTRSLLTEWGRTGAARGIWEEKTARARNAGTEFELITDVTKIKRGDVIVFGSKLGSYGHIGYADEDYPTSKSSTIACYSQNQGGSNGAGQAAAFCVKRCNKAALIGAFRYKAWAGGAAIPVKPTPANPAVYTVVSGDTMSGIAKKFGVPLGALIDANPQVKDINRISVGQVLLVP